jgi:hypothetical protein
MSTKSTNIFTYLRPGKIKTLKKPFRTSFISFFDFLQSG